MQHSLYACLLAAAVALAAGAINAIAGGGTLITFPVLTALGLGAVPANVTNTVALLPGYLGGAWAQRKLLSQPEQRGRLFRFMPAALAGGLLGALLLLATGEKAFRAIVPYLILLAVLLLTFGERIKAGLAARSLASRGGAAPRPVNARPEGALPGAAAVAAIGLASVYGGYFGAGVSVILLAVLGIALEGSLVELNALKQAISLAANLAAATFFAVSGRVDWILACVMATGALLGGAAGGALAGKLRPGILLWVVVILGTAVAAYYFLRG